MTRVVWDQTGARRYETGVDHGVLYIPNGSGVYNTGFAWNGLTTVTESPTGAEANPQYADNIKYANLVSAEDFGATIEAFTYPPEFEQCEGFVTPQPGLTVSQQARKMFGLSYRTLIGNDVDGIDHGYKLHLVYGCLAAPSEKGRATINESPELVQFSWEVTTSPVAVTDLKPTAKLTLDSTLVDADALADLEDFLYGTVGTDPSLPLPDAVLALFAGTVTEVTPTAPTYNASTDIVTIPAVTGVVYSVNGVVTAAGAYGPITANVVVTAAPSAGYKFPAIGVDEWLITFA